MRRALALLPLLLAAAASTRAPPAAPPLDCLASIWQPADPATYGALSLSNAWGSLLLSSQNVLGVNALEMAPFSSGWDAQDLYGWPTDAASLSLNGAPVAPQQTLWTPYSGIRQASTGGVEVQSEVRWVFEAQAVLFEVNLTMPLGGALNASVDFLLPLRYYPRADACDSWHYPTHSEPCCWNWFPPAPAHGQERYFGASWEPCAGGSGGGVDAVSQVDSISAAGSAFAFSSACPAQHAAAAAADSAAAAAPAPPPAAASVACPLSGPPSELNPGHLARLRQRAAQGAGGALIELGAPTATQGSSASWTRTLAPGDTARLRFALAFSNASAPAVNVAAARALAASFPQAWAAAASDWQQRFAAAFDPSRQHFSGALPLLTAGSGSGSNSSGGDWASGFATPMERIYYASVIGLLAMERTNFPPAMPDSPGPCPVSLAASGAFNRSSAAALQELQQQQQQQQTPALEAGAQQRGAGSGMDRYISPQLAQLFTGSAYSGGAGARGGHGGGAGASRLLRQRGGALRASDLLEEAGAPWRMFITGGGMNSSTNIFYWDNQYGAQLLMMLEPETFARQLLLWLGGVDETGLPSYLSFWGYDYAARRGVGNYYSSNLFTLVELLHAYLRVTQDFDFLNTTLSIGPYPNGTYAQRSVYSLALDMAEHWRAMNASGSLADFGDAPNLLECVPSYIHYVAGPNAGNSWMAAAVGRLAGAWAGDAARARALAADAAAIGSEVLQRLYLQGLGYFRAGEADNLTAVQHVMDFVYVTRFLGLQGGESGGGVASGVIPPATAAEMVAWLKGNLLVPHWMRALALSDPAAPLSNRSDHGPSGAYIGWPALTVKALHALGDTAGALAFLNDTLLCATLGPYGQAIEVRPPGDPYKPMDVTLYNELVAHAFGDAIMEVAFGFVLPLVAPGEAPPASPLVDASTPRGFEGTLWGVEWAGKRWDVVSGAGGLELVPA